jgi:transposase
MSSSGVVLAVLQGEMSVAEAARRHGVTATTISNWRDRFIEAGKGGLENKISGRAHGGTVADRRLRSENEQLKLALAEQMVQLRVWQTDFSSSKPPLSGSGGSVW